MSAQEEIHPEGYSQDDIDREAAVQAAGLQEEKYLATLSALDRFIYISNNFCGRVRTAVNNINDDGSDKNWTEDYREFKEELIKNNFLRDIHESIRRLGIDPARLRATEQGRMNDEEKEMMRSVYVDMRRKGFTLKQLKF